MLLGCTLEISLYALYDWYKKMVLGPSEGFPYQKKRLGWWLGVAEASIHMMAYYTQKDTGKVMQLGHQESEDMILVSFSHVWGRAT